MNHKAFFGGNTDEYDIDNHETKINTKTIIQNSKAKIERIQPIRQPTTCAELDETQSYIDDIEYLLAGFQPGKLAADRCLR